MGEIGEYFLRAKISAYTVYGIGPLCACTRVTRAGSELAIVCHYPVERCGKHTVQSHDSIIMYILVVLFRY